jgi:divalent metal cation (Fe/Co/Zn/Cd) transporter
MDAVGGMAVAFFIFFISYVAIRETSLVLLDAYHNPALVEDIRAIVEGEQGVKVRDILLRAAGPYVHAEIHIKVPASTTAAQLDALNSNIEYSVRQEFDGVQRVVVISSAFKD